MKKKTYITPVTQQHPLGFRLMVVTGSEKNGYVNMAIDRSGGSGSDTYDPDNDDDPNASRRWGGGDGWGDGY